MTTIISQEDWRKMRQLASQALKAADSSHLYEDFTSNKLTESERRAYPAFQPKKAIAATVEAVRASRKRERDETPLPDTSDQNLRNQTRFTDALALKPYHHLMHYVPKLVNIVRALQHRLPPSHVTTSYHILPHVTTSHHKPCHFARSRWQRPYHARDRGKAYL